LHERAFVLLPLADIDPRWRHPVSGVPIATLISALPTDQRAEPAGPSDGPGDQR
jgi:2-amino-4-hydroxy-6-hydroxymethyldihydropteridine diphosphokinase